MFCNSIYHEKLPLFGELSLSEARTCSVTRRLEKISPQGRISLSDRSIHIFWNTTPRKAIFPKRDIPIRSVYMFCITIYHEKLPLLGEISISEALTNSVAGHHEKLSLLREISLSDAFIHALKRDTTKNDLS